MPKAPAAHVGHSVPGRLRIKVPSKRSDAVYFAGIQDELSGCPGVLKVEVNALTGSVLLVHAGEPDTVGRFGEERDLFRLAAAPPSPPLRERVSDSVARLNGGISLLLGGPVDWRTCAVLGLVGLGLVQLARGQILAPAVTLLWYAATAGPLAETAGMDTQGRTATGD